MNIHLKRLVENYGQSTVMLNFTQPTSRYFAEQGILRSEDKGLISHLLPFTKADGDKVIELICAIKPDVDIPLEEASKSAFINDFLKMLCQCIDTYPNDITFADDLSTFDILTEEAKMFVEEGASYVEEINDVKVPILEEVNTDALVDKKLSDLEIQLLYKLMKPNSSSGARDMKEELKKALKDTNSAPYRVLKSNYLREASFCEAVKEFGKDVIKDVQNKSIALTESAKSLSVIYKSKKGYKIVNYVS